MKRIRRQTRRPDKRYIRKPYTDPEGIIIKIRIDVVRRNRVKHYVARFHTNGKYVRMTARSGIKRYRLGYTALYGRNPISVILSSL